ncbi:hypothetical protein IFM89_012374 [Coptis chinensis]|uniref:TF-B3 domain-containing protein n=1 Tax=Coptis chinensis TaxID=261450 RepID=A0A835HJF5_9MAGN|nr:hypothetical protein IFM89_012374 [Coptis chinensis]
MGLYEKAIIIDLTTLTQHPQFTRRRSFRTIPRNMSKVVSGRAVTSPSFERDQAPVGLHKTQLCAKERAEELLATLDPVFPSFVKAMTRSYVTKCWMVYILRPYALEAIDLTVNLCPKHGSAHKSIRSCEKTESKSRKTASLAILEFPTVDSITDSEKELPEEFCRLHLPKQDVMFTLIDENHEECLTKYVCRMGNFAISDGWSGFSKSHKLVEGDHLVFQLVKNTSFLVM